jgi:hypothetical protein
MSTILFLGDIVGEPGRRLIKHLLPGLKKEFALDAVCANVENAAGGSGVTPAIADELFDYGIDCMTSGDHIWKKREIYEYLATQPRLLRPANYYKDTPGSGSCLLKLKDGTQLAVMNLIGRVFMNQEVDNPFLVARTLIEEARKKTHSIVVDFHAEATSEKIALGWFLDGLVSAVVGTHTHVPTADEKILPQGTAYITDIGMTGPQDSVIGRKKEQILERFVTGLPTRFEVSDKGLALEGVVIKIDSSRGTAASIARIRRAL